MICKVDVMFDIEEYFYSEFKEWPGTQQVINH